MAGSVRLSDNQFHIARPDTEDPQKCTNINTKTKNLATNTNNTRNLAATKRSCDCCVGQFWPNTTEALRGNID